MKSIVHCCGFAVLCAFSLLLSGCGNADNSPTVANVAGKVTLDGSPMAAGLIIFENPAEGKTGSVEIIKGSYSGKVPIGEMKVSVVLREQVTEEATGGMPVEKVKETPVKSGVEVSVKAGSNDIPEIACDSP